MAAFVVSAPPAVPTVPQSGVRLSIFPGSATPTVFPAGAPFWIGYSFLPDPVDVRGEVGQPLGPETRFELEVDGEPVPVVSEVTRERGRPISKHGVADFPSGLPAGWHRLSGRWFDAGTLVLTSDKAIQFVEP